MTEQNLKWIMNNFSMHELLDESGNVVKIYWYCDMDQLKIQEWKAWLPIALRDKHERDHSVLDCSLNIQSITRPPTSLINGYMWDIEGKNGAYASFNRGVEKHLDGSLTFYATIAACTDILFKMRYVGYDFETSRTKFKQALQAETDKYYVEFQLLLPFSIIE